MSQVNKRAATDEALLEALQHGAWEANAQEMVEVRDIPLSEIPADIVLIPYQVLVANVLLSPSNRMRRV